MKHVLLSLCVSFGAAGAFPPSVPSGYHSYLLPISLASPVSGAYGSSWQTEFSLFNATPDKVIVAPLFPCPLSFVPCPPRGVTLKPGERFDGALLGYPSPSRFIYVQHYESGMVEMNLRVFDNSRVSSTLGSALPIVPATDFRARIDLINVPLSAGYRQMLRIYNAQAEPIEVRMRVYTYDDAATLLRDSTIVVPAANLATFEGSDVPLSPGLVQVSDPVSGAAASRIRIQLESISVFPTFTTPVPVPFWAFLSITNDETQQITIVAPQ